MWLASAWALQIVHLPVPEGSAGEEIRVGIGTDDIAAMPSVELHYRSGGAWRTLGFGPDDKGTWLAVIPGEEVRGPELEYFIASPAGEHFASEDDPWVVLIASMDLEDLNQRELARYGGQRSMVEGWYRSIDHGAGQGLTDETWMGGLRFVYRPLTRRVRVMEFGFVRMRGEAVQRTGWDEDAQAATGRSPVFEQDLNPDARPNLLGRTWNQGLDWGYADVEMPLSELFGLSGRLILGGNDTGFTAGGRVALRVGREPEVYARAWAGAVGGTGVDAGFAMHWNTVPVLPMMASIEVTNWPNTGPWGVVLSYGVWVPLGQHADLGLRIGYQGRTSDLGSLGYGGALSWSF